MSDGKLKKIFLIVGAMGFVYLLVMIGLLTGESPTEIDNPDNTREEQSLKDFPDTPSSDTKLSDLKVPKPSVNTGPIIIALPKQFLTPGLQVLVKDFIKDQKRPVKFETFLDMQEYRSHLNSEFRNGETTIALLPSHWIESYSNSSYDIRLHARSQDYLHASTHSFANGYTYTIVPFVLDPLVSIFDQELDIQVHNMTLEELYGYFGKQTNYDATEIPFLFGFDGLIAQRIRLRQEPWPHYQLALYLMIQSWFKNNNTQSFKSLVDMQKYPVVNFASSTLNKYIDQGESTRSHCALLPHLCMLAADHSQFSFALLSDMLLYEKYFMQTENKQELTVGPFVQYNPSLPTVVWGWAISKNSEDIVPGLEFIGSYMQSCADKNSRLWGYMSLPACTQAYNDKIMDPSFATLRPYLSNISILQGGANEVENFFTQTKVLKTLEGEYNVDLFFSRPGREL